MRPLWAEVAKRGDELAPPGAATGRDWRQGIKRSGDVQTLFCGQCNPGSAPAMAVTMAMAKTLIVPFASAASISTRAAAPRLSLRPPRPTLPAPHLSREPLSLGLLSPRRRHLQGVEFQFVGLRGGVLGMEFLGFRIWGFFFSVLSGALPFASAAVGLSFVALANQWVDPALWFLRWFLRGRWLLLLGCVTPRLAVELGLIWEWGSRVLPSGGGIVTRNCAFLL